MQTSFRPPTLSLYHIILTHFLLPLGFFHHCCTLSQPFGPVLAPVFGNVVWGVWLSGCGAPAALPWPAAARPSWALLVNGQGLTLLGCSWVVLPWEWEEPHAPTLLKPPLAWGHAESPGSAAGRGSALCPPSTKANLFRGRSADATLSSQLEDTDESEGIIRVPEKILRAEGKENGLNAN